MTNIEEAVAAKDATKAFYQDALEDALEAASEAVDAAVEAADAAKLHREKMLAVYNSAVKVDEAAALARARAKITYYAIEALAKGENK